LHLKDGMNHDEIIFETQLAALMRLIAAVFAVTGLQPDGPVLSSLSAEMRRRVLRILSASESALRRLISYRAQRLSLKARRKRAARNRAIPKSKGAKKRPPVFALFDPRKWFQELAKTSRSKRGPDPSISGFDEDRRASQPDPSTESKSETDPAGLCRRLQALHRALHDIPAQARRLARLQARRKAAGETLRRTEPIRPGYAPGFRRRPTHPVDHILWNCAALDVEFAF